MGVHSPHLSTTSALFQPDTSGSAAHSLEKPSCQHPGSRAHVALTGLRVHQQELGGVHYAVMLHIPSSQRVLFFI